jgi:outer membrane receptor for ferrienterochelin and colicin
MYVYSIDDPEVKNTLKLDNLYGYFNTSYKNSLGKKWSYLAGLSYSINQDMYSLDTATINDRTSGGQLKMAFSGDINSHISLNTGMDAFLRDDEFTYAGNTGELSNSLSFREWILATFLEADIYITSDLLARIGFRSEYSHLNNTHRIDPRVSLAYKLGNRASVSFAYGTFQQSAKEDLLRIVNDLGNERSAHYILNYQYIHKGKTFRVEGYYKQYKNLVKYDPDNMYDPAQYNNTGSGYARGFDIFWRDSYSSLKNVDYWISYSFLDTERDYRDFPERSIPVFASKHNISISYKQFFPKLRSFLSGTYTYASPRPYNDLNSDGFNTGRTKSYHDLSLTIAHMVSENIGLFVMSTNVLGFNNVFGYEYGQNINEEGLYNRRAIIQPAKRFILIGVTITLSKNGVMNQLRSL